MSEQLFPRNGNQLTGWTIETSFLKYISDCIEGKIEDFTASLEDIELVLLEVENYRLSELEKAQQENERLKELVKVNHTIVVHMTEQNQKLIEALGWYADETNYKQEYRSEGVLMYSTNVRDDRGQRARDILQEVSHGTSTES